MQTVGRIICSLIFLFAFNPVTRAQVGQVTLGKPIDCNSAPVTHKLLLPLRETMEKVIRENSLMNGTTPGRVLEVQVISTTLVYTGSPVYEGMLYQQCEVTGVALVQMPDGRTGRIPIRNLPVSLGYDERGTLHVQSPPDGQLF